MTTTDQLLADAMRRVRVLEQQLARADAEVLEMREELKFARLDAAARENYLQGLVRGLLRRLEDSADDGCPKNDPGCLADNGACHDACEDDGA